MKGLVHVLSALAVIGLAVWAYRENYRTQEALAEVNDLHREIGAAHARLRMLNAEWAYLNRPDRLRELAAINFDRLELLPFTPEGFGRLADVPQALPDILPLGTITDPVELSSGPVATNPGEEPL